MVYSNQNSSEKFIIVDCESGYGNSIKISKFTYDKDKYYYLDIYSLDFYAKQTGIFKTIFNRLKLIFLILSGKEYRMANIVLTENDIKELTKKLKNITSKDKQVLLEKEMI